MQSKLTLSSILIRYIWAHDEVMHILCKVIKQAFICLKIFHSQLTFGKKTCNFGPADFSDLSHLTTKHAGT